MTNEQAQALYDEWRASGETQRAFLIRKRLNLKLFHNHYPNLNIRFRTRKSETLQMLPIKVLAPAVENVILSDTPLELSLQFSGGSCLRFRVGTPVEYLGRLAHALESGHVC